MTERQRYSYELWREDPFLRYIDSLATEAAKIADEVTPDGSVIVDADAWGNPRMRITALEVVLILKAMQRIPSPTT